LKKCFFLFAVVVFTITWMACSAAKDIEEIVFYNCSPQTVTELKVYHSEEVKNSNDAYHIKTDCVYTYTDDIETYNYHILSGLHRGEYIFEAHTANGNIYSSKRLDLSKDNHYANGGYLNLEYVYSIVFTADYKIMQHYEVTHWSY